MNQRGQGQSGQRTAPRPGGWQRDPGAPRGLITPHPKLKLLDQVREVMRLKHYSIRTERSYCDWIRRYIDFHAYPPAIAPTMRKGSVPAATGSGKGASGDS